MIKNILAAAALGIVAFGAQANELTNGSFESNSLGSEYSYNVTATGWTTPLLITSNSGAWGNPSAKEGSFDLGNVVAGIQNTQVLTSGFQFIAGHTYELTWDDAGRSGYDTQSYTVSAGGVTFADFTTAGGQAWSEHTETFTATSTGDLSFSGHQTRDGTSFIDNVSVITTAVPEPTSMLMMSVATLGLLAWRRRSRG